MYPSAFHKQIDREDLGPSLPERSSDTSQHAVRAKLKQAILYIERNPKLVQSITSFPYIVKSS
jgi:hypothetical protein